MKEATAIDSDTMFDYFNSEYMAGAKYSQPGMLRIPQETAKNILLNGDAPVFRLMPRSVELMSNITAAKNGLNFQNFREFAVKKDDRAGIDKLCSREIAEIVNKPQELDSQKKRDKTNQEL